MGRFWRDVKGSVAVTMGVALVPLSVAAGVAVDYTRTAWLQTKAQQAIDAAVLAGAQAADANRSTTAQGAFAAAFSMPAGAAVTASFATNADGTFSGAAQGTIASTLMRLVGVPAMAVRASATATPAKRTPVCVLLLQPSGSGLTMSSNSLIDAPNCEIDIKSSGASAALLNSGSAINSSQVCAQGAFTLNSAASRASYKANCASAADTLGSALPAPPAASPCRYNNKTWAGGNNTSITVQQGDICGGMNFNTPATVTFEPGVYRVRGGPIKFNSSVSVIAAGVTFYFEDANSTLQMNSAASFSITPPNSGTYANIAMYEASIANRTDLTINSSSSGSMEGVFYLPSRNITLNSAASLNARRLSFVANTMLFNSSSAWNIDAVADASKRIYTVTPAHLLN
ncbi:pilus assembly protein TadG-related protein [Alsobacter soli]|nr:pilus assembly protein TadG-related protein [Alsobacter soli]